MRTPKENKILTEKLIEKYWSEASQKRIIKQFILFLEENGAKILNNTNLYELTRFKANNNTGIIYKNKWGKISSMNNEAIKAFDLFLAGEKYETTKNKKIVKKGLIINHLLKRDGKKCFYCQKKINEGEETLEYILSIIYGGNNNIANMALCHQECNRKADKLSVVEKIKLRESFLFKNGGFLND